MVALCRLDDVRRSFRSYGDDVPVLGGIDLEIAPDERLGVEGPSGVGKSTLLAILGVLDTGFTGRYEFDGVDVRGLRERDASRLRLERIGAALQAPTFVPVMDVRDNVGVPAMAAGAAVDAARDRAQRALDGMGLGHRGGADPATLSGGERRRAAIARALTNEPDLLLLDEPEAGLDEANLRVVRDLLHDRDRVRAAVVVTHDAQLLAECDRVVSIVDGRLQPLGGPEAPEA